MEAGDVSFWNHSYDKALQYYDLASADPKLSAKLAGKKADVLFSQGNFKLAASQYELAIEDKPSDLELRMKYADSLSYEKLYPEAIEQYDEILAIDPDLIDAQCHIARVYSWDTRFEEAIAAYDKCIALEYSPKEARQKARVLGWWKHYDASLDAYKKLYAKTGDEAVWLESQAKRYYWNGWVFHALRDFDKLLELEPDNVEALFDKGQLEDYNRMWSEATANYDKIIELQPNHFRADAARNKTELAWKKRRFTPRLDWFRARSDSRDTHINRYSAGGDLYAPLHQKVAIVGGYRFDEFLFDNAGSISRHQGQIGLDLSFTPNVWASGSYKPTGYPYMNRLSHLFDGSLSVRPFDPIVLTAFTMRDDLYNQRIVFDKQLHSTDVGGRIEAKAHRRWTILGDYRYRMINDSNRQHKFGIENLVFISFEPKRLTIDLRFDFQDWKQRTTDYWSPSNFWHVIATAHWRHYLNPNGMFFGAKNTYYGFKARFQIDRDKKPFIGGTFEFNRDWYQWLSTDVEVFGNYSSIYNDVGALAKMVIRF